MDANQVPDRRTGSIAIALAVVWVSIPLSFALFAAFEEPFGSISDISVGVVALLSGLLATGLYASHQPISPAAPWPSLPEQGACTCSASTSSC